MELNKVIYSGKLAGFRPIIWLGEAVFRRENQIRSVMKDRLGEEYAELFSNIVIHSGATPSLATASWMTAWLNKAHAIGALPEQQQLAVKQKLKDMMGRISALCAELKQSGNREYEELSEVILLATHIPFEDCIMSDGQKIVLVFWGFINDASENKGVELMKFLHYDFDDLSLKGPVIKKDTGPVIKETPPIVQKEEPPLSRDTASVKESGISAATTPPPKKRRFRWWWILVILGALLLLLLLFFLLRGCMRGLPVLPDQGLVPPIDTTKIITNPGDTLQRPVLGNRLNVILDKNAKMQDFAQEFADAFGQDAKIVYVDTVIMQVQVEFYTDDIPTWKERIKTLKGVRIVFEESIFRSSYAPGDPGFQRVTDSWQFTAIRAAGGWDITRGKADVVIAVIDDGFDLTHPELKGRYTDPWNVPENAPRVHTNRGKSFHGTHVAALAIGNMDNRAGTSGVAPQCMFMPIQISDINGNMSTTYIINGFLYALTHGADVINMSLGMQWPPFVKNMPVENQKKLAREMYPEEAQFWDEMYAYAEDYDVVVVQAAGNDNVITSIDPMKRSVRTIVVAASDPMNSRSVFSNFGERADVTAPGTQVFSAIPASQYGYLDGTSMASPIVAGAAGLLRSVNPALKNADVRDILVRTGIQVASAADRGVGPLIQLDKALQAAESYQPQTCDELVDSLLNVIDRLKQKVCDTADQMKMPEGALDCGFTKGQWVSSKNLVNGNTQVPVQLFFDFDGKCAGKMTFSEQGGNRCHATVKCRISGRKLTIEQDGNASCSNGTEYTRHVFDCVPDASGILQCSARRVGSSTVLVKFTLNRL